MAIARLGLKSWAKPVQKSRLLQALVKVKKLRHRFAKLRRPPFHLISRSNLSERTSHRILWSLIRETLIIFKTQINNTINYCEVSVDRPETGVQRSGYQLGRYHPTAPTFTTREYSLPGSATRSCSLHSQRYP
ncbi:hypothetical protein evm_013085 [Chilo suppressalis]|nr:hypothetical protein evm_013085 [Chilo suppressalis]